MGVYPSRQDIALTEQVKKAAEVMRIAVIDYVILSDDSCYSFAEERTVTWLFRQMADN